MFSSWSWLPCQRGREQSSVSLWWRTSGFDHHSSEDKCPNEKPIWFHSPAENHKLTFALGYTVEKTMKRKRSGKQSTLKVISYVNTTSLPMSTSCGTVLPWIRFLVSLLHVVIWGFFSSHSLYSWLMLFIKATQWTIMKLVSQSLDNQHKMTLILKILVS